jgi:hypothetical protein
MPDKQRISSGIHTKSGNSGEFATKATGKANCSRAFNPAHVEILIINVALPLTVGMETGFTG